MNAVNLKYLYFACICTPHFTPPTSPHNPPPHHPPIHHPTPILTHHQVHVHTFSVLPSRSGSARGYEERTVLNVLNKRITAVSLSGYIFFGSSIKISDKVQQLAMTLLQSDKQVCVMWGVWVGVCNGGEGMFFFCLWLCICMYMCVQSDIQV